MPLPQRDEQLDRAEATVTEAKVRTDEHESRVQPVDKHVLDKLLWRLHAEFGVELDHHRCVDTRRVEHRAFLVIAREARRAELRLEQGERMPVEGEHRREKSFRRRRITQLLDHTTVTGVHAIELSNGHGGRAEIGGHPAQRGVELHR